MLGLFEDLEQQAEGLALTERDLEVAELSRAEYAQVTLEDRLHASTEHEVVLSVAGVGRVVGTLARVGTGWCLVVSGHDERTVPAREWIVRLDAVQRAAGLSGRALHDDQRPLSSRLGLGSALRAVAVERGEVLVHGRDGSVLRGRLGRVGADFVELDLHGAAETGGRRVSSAGRREVLPFSALAALRRG